MEYAAEHPKTFLFTDIEGSTQLWETQTEGMSGDLKIHDRILHQEIEDRNGSVFKTVGDAFCATFSEPQAALEAAAAIQRRLRSQDWETEGIRVRVGIHTGTAEERNGDFFGRTVNHCARIMSAGHGGQILISHTTREQLPDDRLEGFQFRDLGICRLKDLKRP